MQSSIHHHVGDICEPHRLILQCTLHVKLGIVLQRTMIPCECSSGYTAVATFVGCRHVTVGDSVVQSRAVTTRSFRRSRVSHCAHGRNGVVWHVVLRQLLRYAL